MTRPPLEIRRHLSCCGKTLTAYPETMGPGWEGEAHAAAHLTALFKQHKDTCPSFQVEADVSTL